MIKKSTIIELRSMSQADLHKEILAKKSVVGKMRLGIQMRTEKDSARYLREKRDLARMLTAMNEKKRALPKASTPATLPAPAAKKRPSRKAA